jgi:hypothetical protein
MFPFVFGTRTRSNGRDKDFREQADPMMVMLKEYAPIVKVQSN